MPASVKNEDEWSGLSGLIVIGNQEAITAEHFLIDERENVKSGSGGPTEVIGRRACEAKEHLRGRTGIDALAIASIGEERPPIGIRPVVVHEEAMLRAEITGSRGPGNLHLAIGKRLGALDFLTREKPGEEEK